VFSAHAGDPSNKYVRQEKKTTKPYYEGHSRLNAREGAQPRIAQFSTRQSVDLRPQQKLKIQTDLVKGSITEAGSQVNNQ
jgi:hypothetical protein